MSTHERLSFIIPAHNAAPFIADAIESVLRQRYTNIEVIVVDDASTDGTRDIVAAFGSRILLVPLDTQQGVSNARNRGVARASGDWLAFLDADDWLPPDFAERAMSSVRLSEALCYDSTIVRDPSEAISMGSDASEISLHSRAKPWAQTHIDRTNLVTMFSGAPLLKSVVHRDDFFRAGGFDPRFRGGEDFHYHIKLVASGTTLRLVSEPHGYYRIHASQATAATSSGKTQDIRRHLQSCLEWITMFKTLPREVPLDAASVRACRSGVRYWQYRFVRGSLLATIRRRDLSFIANLQFLSSASGAAMAFVARAGERLTRGSSAVKHTPR